MSINSQIGTPLTTPITPEFHDAANEAEQELDSWFQQSSQDQVPVAHPATVAVIAPPVVIAAPAAVTEAPADHIPSPVCTQSLSPVHAVAEPPASRAEPEVAKIPEGAPDLVQEDVETEQVLTGGSIKPKPVVTRVNGLTMLSGNVIPKREASRIKGHYMTASRALMRSTRFTATEKLVIIYLMDMLMDKERCWPGLNTIAGATGLSRRTTIAVVNKLADAGVIIKDPGGGRKHSTAYYLTQGLFPCRLHPETLCNRDDTCQEKCPWMRTNSADVAPFMPDPSENKQCEICTLSQTNSADIAPFMPVNSADIAPKEKNNNSNEKEEDGKRSCPPGAGDRGSRLSLSIDMQEVDADSRSGHVQVKDLFCQMYEQAFGKAYRWQAKDGSILKKILADGYNLVQIKAATDAMFQDPWAVDGHKASMTVLSSKFNQYLPASGPQGLPAPSAIAGGSWEGMAIEVHTLPVDGEQPATWPWPLQYTVRRDGDISLDKKGWQMSQFSGEIIRQVERWLNSENWALTMYGPPGNGKSTVASSILQSYRDLMFPTDDNQNSSAYVSFEEFERFAVLDNVNPDTGWVGESEINREFLDNLADKTMLVLDDLGNRSMSKLHTDALHDLLRIREERGSFGYKTIISTNRTIAELGQMLGASVADRIAGGVMLRFVDNSLRGRTNAKPLGVPAPEGDDLVKAATTSLKAMDEYIQYGPGAFQRPRSFEKAPTAFDMNGRANETIESIAGAYWSRLCRWAHTNGQPLHMPVWQDIFWAVQELATVLGGLRNAGRYIDQLTIRYWMAAVSAVRQHAETSGEDPYPSEVFFLSPAVWKVMEPVVCGMKNAG